MIKLIRTLILLALLTVSTLAKAEYYIYSSDKDIPHPDSGRSIDSDFRDGAFFETVVGTGLPVVIILGRASSFWSKFVDEHKEKYEFHIFLQRGFNGVIPGEFQLNDNTFKSIEYRLKKRKVENALLIGQEFGGNLAIQLANNGMVKFKKIALINTFLDYHILGAQNGKLEPILNHPLNTDFSEFEEDLKDYKKRKQDPSKMYRISVPGAPCQNQNSAENQCKKNEYRKIWASPYVNPRLRYYFYQTNQTEIFKKISIDKTAFFSMGWLDESQLDASKKIISSQFDEKTKIVFRSENTFELRYDKLTDIFNSLL